MKIQPSVLFGTSIVALLFGLLASGSVLAQGLYAYGAVGQSTLDLNKSDIDSMLTNAGATGLSSSVGDTDTAYKVQLGYMFNKNWGVEGGWVDLGKFDYKATYTGGSGSADVKGAGFNIAGIGVLPLNNSFSLFARLGTINAKVKMAASFTGPGGTASGSVTDTSWSTNYGFGAMYNFSPKMAVRAEWERFSKLGDKNKTGEGDVDLLSVGLKYSF